MKKVFMLFAVVALFASCAPKATEETTESEDSVIIEQTINTTDVDSLVVDTLVVDTTIVAE